MALQSSSQALSLLEAVSRANRILSLRCSHAASRQLWTAREQARQSARYCRRFASTSALDSISSTTNHGSTQNERRYRKSVTQSVHVANDSAVEAVDRILSTDSIVPDQEALEVMKGLLASVENLHPSTDAPSRSPLDKLPFGSQEISHRQSPEAMGPSASAKALQYGAKATALMRHPPLFISSPLLETYVSLQLLIRQPQPIPEIFWLYANKPLPRRTRSSTPKYVPAWPNSPKSAIPKQVADRALDYAILTRDLPLAQEIVDTTFATTAHKTSRLIREGGVPLGLLLLSPLAAYVVSSRIASNLPNLDPSTTTWTIFALMCAYVGWTSSIGIVAATTSNSHMQRVAWQVGTMLRERWLREDEREAIDRVACAWGFKDRRRRGEETGKTWAELHDWAGRNGMILDKVSLMDGME